MGYCEAADCLRTTRHGHRLCDAHERRRSRGDDLTTPIRSRPEPFARLTDAALRYADADPEDDSAYERAKGALREASEFWCASRGWRPPPTPRFRRRHHLPPAPLDDALPLLVWGRTTTNGERR